MENKKYYITTPIIMKLLEEKLDLESITVMIQKEVADRLIAIPGKKNTGAITYSVYYYASSEAILEVPKDSFIPAPEVTSKVIKLNIRKEPPVVLKDEKIFFKVVKASFMQRRKTLLNGLANAGIASKEKLKDILLELNLSEKGFEYSASDSSKYFLDLLSNEYSITLTKKADWLINTLKSFTENELKQVIEKNLNKWGFDTFIETNFIKDAKDE